MYMLAMHPQPGKRYLPKSSLFSKRYMFLLGGLLAVVVASCQPKKQSTSTVAATQPLASLPATKKILSKNRRFVYAVRWEAAKTKTAVLDTVTMTASGAPCPFEATQTCFEWLFRADTVWPAGFRGSVGAFENAQEFWIHPPRYGRYRILELNPFPYLKLPAVSGRKWDWEVYAPAYYADPAWARWQGTVRVRFRYALGGAVQLATPLGRLRCARIQASGASKLGTTALEAFFHPAYGFVQLHYRNIDASRVQLEMVAVDVRPESSERILSRFLRFPQPDSGISRANSEPAAW
jgi:hypothetical protein